MISTLLFYVQTINLAFALGGLALLGLTIGLFADYISNKQQLYVRFVERYVWLLLMAVSIGGVVVTLLYSEIFGFVPCSLCWLQRIALYPQALLSVIAFRCKDEAYYPLYGMALSVFGFAVAVYQYIYQMVPHELITSGILPCLADGTADCSKKVMEVFGFVTFPFLSAVMFAFLFVLYLHIRKRHNI